MENNNAEQQYWDYKANLDRTYGDLQHEAVMTNQITEQEYKLFSLLRPKIYIDGDKWCVLYGENIQDGIVGFGSSPYLAILDFNKSFNSKLKTESNGK